MRRMVRPLVVIAALYAGAAFAQVAPRPPSPPPPSPPPPELAPPSYSELQSLIAAQRRYIAALESRLDRACRRSPRACREESR